MNLELGKRYVVDVTNKGIIPIDEFSTVRFFDKDSDDLDFLTDEEKVVIINRVLTNIRKKIENRPYGIANDSVIQGEIYERRAVLEIIDKYMEK